MHPAIGSRRTPLPVLKSTVYPAGNFFPASLTEAKFVNMAAGDYRLADGSPYVNAGTDGKDLGAESLLLLPPQRE